MDTNKLPKWAQKILQDKDYEIHNLKEMVKALSRSNEKTKVHYCVGDIRKPCTVYLPEGRPVTFDMSPEKYEEIDVRP